MHEIHLRGLDLNLLLALHALLEERHVTRASERIGLSQSAMSHALGRLRQLFADPLLVRSSKGMVPTPRAEALAAQLQQILLDIEQIIHSPTFDPRTAQGTIQLTATDYGTTVILPSVLRQLSVEAPNLNLECHHWSSSTLEQLKNGSIDLALGGQDPPANKEFKFQELFVEDFASIVRADHPVIQNELTLESYTSWPHALITVTNSRMGYVDTVLERLGVKRRILLRLPHFLAAPLIVAQSDLVLTLPRRLATLLASFAGLSVFDPPIPLGEFDYIQVWHERKHHDPLNIWLRELIAAQTKDNVTK